MENVNSIKLTIQCSVCMLFTVCEDAFNFCLAVCSNNPLRKCVVNPFQFSIIIKGRSSNYKDSNIYKY